MEFLKIFQTLITFRENSVKVFRWLLGEDFTIGYCKEPMSDGKLTTVCDPVCNTVTQ